MCPNAVWRNLFLVSVLSTVVPVTALAEQNDSAAKDQEAPEASSNWQASIGVKLHPNRASGITGILVPTVAGIVDTSDAVRSSTELTPFLFGSIRYKNFFISASHFLDTNYNLKLQQSGVLVDINRNETDANIGYYVLPSLSLSVGYKEVKFGGGLGDAKYAGPVIGISGYGSMGSGFGLYGSFAYGALTLSAAVDVSNEAKKYAYLNSEVGLAYSFDFRDRGGFLSAITLTLGYRYQNIESKNSVPSQLVVDSGGGVLIPLGPPASVRINNTSQGPVLGLIVTF